MKVTGSFVFAFLVLTLSNGAWASSSLKIFGSGVASKAGDSIALMCVGPESETSHPCSQMQFGYFENGVVVNPIPLGPIYQLSNLTGTPADEAALSKATVRMIKEMQKYARKKGKAGRGIVAMAITIGIGGALTCILNAGLPLFVGVAIWVGCATQQCDPRIMDPTARISNAFAGNVGIQEAILDQNGWNWADRPARIGPKKFKKFYDLLLSSGSSTDVRLLEAK